MPESCFRDRIAVVNGFRAAGALCAPQLVSRLTEIGSPAALR
jgi:hypothetical protein